MEIEQQPKRFLRMAVLLQSTICLFFILHIKLSSFSHFNDGYPNNTLAWTLAGTSGDRNDPELFFPSGNDFKNLLDG